MFNYFLPQFDNLLVLFHHQPQFYHTGVPHYYISLLQLDELHEMKVQYKIPENILFV